MSVLLVEDEALMRMLLADELASLGLEVVEAATGEEALRLLEEGLHPVVVVTDVRLPGTVDGLQVAGWVEAHRAGVPVIVATGSTLPGDLETQNTAIRAIFSKPYDTSELARLALSLAR